MNKKTIGKRGLRLLSVLLLVAVFFGAFSLVSCNNTEKKEDGSNDNKNSTELVQVLRLVDEIKIGGKFTNDKLQTVTVRADAVPEDAFSDIAELRNKYAVSHMYPGDYITPDKMSDTKPADSEEDGDGSGGAEIDPEALGYIVVSEYKEPGKSMSDVINGLIEKFPGKTLYFPDGSYSLTAPIVIPADPAKSVSLRLSNNAVISARDWPDKELAMIRIGVDTSETEGVLSESMEDAGLENARSVYVMGGCILGNGMATGISIEGGKGAYIYNVAIKTTHHGIHVYPGNNEQLATYVNVDNVNITGTDSAESVGVLVEGTHNTFSNMRIASIKFGVVCTETGSDNIFRNLHPLASTAHGKEGAGFWDRSNGNQFDVCYSDQFATGFLMASNTRSVYNGCFCYWYSNANNYHVGFRSEGQFNSIVISGKVSHGHNVETDAYLLVGEDGGEGIVLYPLDSTRSNKYEYVLKQYCKTPIS